jgi:hypothetical protein
MMYKVPVLAPVLDDQRPSTRSLEVLSTKVLCLKDHKWNSGMCRLYTNSWTCHVPHALGQVHELTYLLLHLVVNGAGHVSTCTRGGHHCCTGQMQKQLVTPQTWHTWHPAANTLKLLWSVFSNDEMRRRGVPALKLVRVRGLQNDRVIEIKGATVQLCPADLSRAMRECTIHVMQELVARNY